jgi:hypothetical protein
MAFVYVTEYSQLGGGGAMQVPMDPPIADYRVAFGAAGAAFNTATRFIRVHADAICSVIVGPATGLSAAATNRRFAAGQTEYVAVPQNQGYALACITNT